MTELATNFVKAGMANEADKLAVLAAKYQNTADEELTAAEATSVLVSQMKAFDYETAESAIHITDSINQVSQDFAVSSSDIGKGLTQAGAALSTYGNSFDQTVGLIY